jgi:thymidylate synthase
MLHTRNDVDNVRESFKLLKEREMYVIDKTGVKMLEIINASFIADQPAIFGTVNYDYVMREIEWYKSQSLNVNDIPGGPPSIWQQVADAGGYVNSNYGWCVYSKENRLQYSSCLNELKNNPFSRRAIMIYTRPSMQYDYNLNGRSDFMCTNSVQYLIRENKLHAVVQMRSNDVVYGYKNDFAWQETVLNELSSDLGLDMGYIHWNVGSLHVYERHFDLVI